MLKDRVVTAAVLVPLLLAAIFIVPAPWFELVAALVFVAAAWEWGALMDCTTRRGRWAFTALAALAIAGAGWWMHVDARALPLLVVLALGWWVVALVWLTCRPAARTPCALKGLCGLLTLVPAFAAFVALHGWDEHGPTRVLFVLLLVWLADIGAYFAGRRFGRLRLAPRVSPGKTWEGVVGAFAAAAVVIAIGWQFGMAVGTFWYFIALCTLTVAVSIVGDLSESMFKRQHGVKDSGRMLPGHGGVLDRIDSLTAAGPVFVAGMLLAEAL